MTHRFCRLGSAGKLTDGCRVHPAIVGPKRPERTIPAVEARTHDFALLEESTPTAGPQRNSLRVWRRGSMLVIPLYWRSAAARNARTRPVASTVRSVEPSLPLKVEIPFVAFFDRQLFWNSLAVPSEFSRS